MNRDPVTGLCYLRYFPDAVGDGKGVALEVVGVVPGGGMTTTDHNPFNPFPFVSPGLVSLE